jgi:hypothetical protein
LESSAGPAKPKLAFISDQKFARELSAHASKRIAGAKSFESVTATAGIDRDCRGKRIKP